LVFITKLVFAGYIRQINNVVLVYELVFTTSFQYKAFK